MLASSFLVVFYFSLKKQHSSSILVWVDQLMEINRCKGVPGLERFGHYSREHISGRIDASKVV